MIVSAKKEDGIMDKILRVLFDYQQFANHERLAAVIRQSASEYRVPLADDDLEFVNAAGEITASSRTGAVTGDYPHV